jgi:hypothetical protein
MKLKKSRLNNKGLNFQRKDLMYEAIMTDLYLMGAIPKEIAEQYTGVKISDELRAPEEIDG